VVCKALDDVTLRTAKSCSATATMHTAMGMSQRAASRMPIGRGGGISETSEVTLTAGECCGDGDAVTEPRVSVRLSTQTTPAPAP